MGCPINYDTTHNKAAHKYFYKPFYNRTNKNVMMYSRDLVT